MKGVMNLNKEIVEGMFIALIFIAGYYLVKTKRINILWKVLAAVNILSWACLLVILALDINVSADFISLNLAACMSLAIICYRNKYICFYSKGYCSISSFNTIRIFMLFISIKYS